MPQAEVVLYTKPGCCLCDEVKTQLQNLRLRHNFELREINIEDNQALTGKFKEEIPLVLVNGRKAFRYHLDEKEFVRELLIRDCRAGSYGMRRART